MDAISGGAGERVGRRTLFAGAAAGLAGASMLAAAGPAAATSGTISLDWISVTNSTTSSAGVTQPGAAGDGVTDDTKAIQNAIGAVVAAGNGGGVVYFPYGHYLITTPLTVPSGITLLGECTFGMYPAGTAGGQAPTIVLSGGSDTVPVFSGAAAIDITAPAAGLSSIRIEGLVLNGGNLTSGTTAGILLTGTVDNVVLRHVVASSFPGTGFSLQASSGNHPVAYMERCTAWQNGGHGFDLYITDCEITSCMAYENKQNGFNLQRIDDVQFLGCRAEHNGQNGFFYGDTAATSTMLFDACTTDQNSQNGILISGAVGSGPVQITGCSLRRDGVNGGAGSTSYAGLALAGANIPVVVTGTSVQAMLGDGTKVYGPYYAVKMTGSSFLAVVGGYFGGVSTGSTFDWDGAGALRLSSSVLTGVNSSGAPHATTTAPLSPFGAPPPSANGFIAWTADPWVAPTSASSGVAKYLYLNAVYVQAPVVTEAAWFHVSVAGVGVTAGANWIALYGSGGNLLASAAIDAAAGSTGLQSVSWTTPAMLAPGMYFVGIVFNATTTMPALYRSSETLLAAMNANLAAPAYRTSIAMKGAAYTTAPSSIDTSMNAQSVSSNDAQPYWLAIS